MKKLVSNASLIKIIWLVFGSTLLFCLQRIFSDPLTSLQFVLMSLGPLLSSLVIPGIFIITSLRADKDYVLFIFINVLMICTILDIYIIFSGWDFGLQYQGREFVIKTAWQNSLCFLLIYSLLGGYFKWGKIILLQATILLFFITLSIFAFPWFGEML